MADAVRGRVSGWGVAAVAAVVLAALGALLARAQQAPSGVEPVAWDRAACAHCRMHVGDPRFAAQLQTEEGEVLNFDDPGCLLRYAQERRPRVRAMYFHDVRDDRWWARDEVGFVTMAPTPMGYGIAATRRGAPGAMSYEQAFARVTARGEAPR
ncbi:MAG: hypothetical protein EPO40_04880 [Myxococcaceae bacterium]|nr:MAG: hypothetical protein EPO40_04880 [Myxococcaceae bacterium]